MPRPDDAPPGYAPFGLVTDPSLVGLVTTTLRTEAGTVVARHRAGREPGPATLLLHGAAGSWSTWTPLLATAAAAGHGIRNPVLLDLPGWGGATPARGDAQPTIDSVSELVRRVVTELGYDEWHVVGHSLGGFIALHLATLWPQSVLSVGLVSGTTHSVVEAVAHPRAGMASIPGFVLLLGFFRFVAPAQPAVLAIVAGLRRVGILRLASKPLFRHLFRIDPTVIAALGVELRPRSFVTAAEVARGYDVGRWRAIACPVRATKGDRDVFVTDADLERLARELPDCVGTVVADCGHFGNVERPAEVLAALGLRT
jgi:pimeloyl-ACP methyl ester carboxylesterase